MESFSVAQNWGIWVKRVMSCSCVVRSIVWKLVLMIFGDFDYLRRCRVLLDRDRPFPLVPT